MSADLPDPPDNTPLLQRREVLVITLLWSLSLLPLLAFVIEWSLAWATLGHIPVPMIDDPKYISGFCSLLHVVTALALMLVIPAGVIAALFYLLAWGPKFRRFLVAGIGAGMPFGVFAMLDKFPYDAFGWWFD